MAAELNEKGIELHCVAGNIYDSLEGRDRDSYTYVTANETPATTTSTGNNDDRKEHSNGAAQHVTFATIYLVVGGMLLFCIITCALSGVVVYNVINDKMYERHACDCDQSTTRGNADALAMESKLAEFNDAWSKQIDLLTNNHSESRDYLVDMNRRLEVLDDAVQETVETVEIIQEQQNTSSMTSRDYRIDNDHRFEALQKKQNISGEQVAFTVHSPTGVLVDGVALFKIVLLNLGNSYNQTTGKVICPTAGLYHFAVTLLAKYSRSGSMWCDILKNGTAIANAHNEEGRYGTASVAVGLLLSVGDVVELQCKGWQNVHPYHNTIYTGMLINAD